MKFDPFGTVSRYLPERLLHRLIRIAMAGILAIFLWQRIRHYELFAVKALWLAETALFAVLIIAFLCRTNPVHRSSGVQEIIIPLLGSALPFALLLAPPAPLVTNNRTLFSVLLWGMTAATILTVAGMWTARRAFSITVEARVLVTGGPYRLIRHPIYTGEMLAAAAVAGIRFSLQNMAILSLFVAIQLYRSRLEEAKLRSTFPGYRQFAAGSWWFWK
jgi:protein-S-isoprenylcysteine O-methyltransferase Ste14